MNIVLWILQGLLAFVFLANGVLKISQPKENLKTKFAWKWVDQYSDSNVKLIGVAEFLGALGLILPLLTGILPWLTSLAAFCLVLVMVGGALAHLRLKETMAINIVFGVMAVVVGVGRLLV